MANSYFTGISNEILYNNVINAGTINSGSVKSGTIFCDSVQISLPKTPPIVKVTWDNNFYLMKSEDIALMTRGLVLYDDNGQTTTGVLSINKTDTPDEALRLLALFNITDTTTTRLIIFKRINKINGAIFSIGAASGINCKFVQYMVKSSGTAQSAASFGGNSSSRDVFVLVYRGSDIIGTLEKTIVFDVIGQTQ